MARAAKKATVTSLKDRDLPGLEDRGIQEIDDAAANFLMVQGQRVALTNQEREANEQVVQIMQKHGKDYYRFQELEVSIDRGKVKAKVKHGNLKDGE